MQRTTYFTLFLCLLSVGLFPGCDSEEEEALDEISGTWVGDNGGVDIFLRITRSTITVAVEEGSFSSCEAFEILDYNADAGVMTIRDADDPEDDEDDITVRRSGDDLLIEGDVYVRTNSFPASCS